MAEVLLLTERGARHQARALSTAPAELRVVALRQPDPATLHAALAGTDYLLSERRGVIDGVLLAVAPRLKLIQRIGSLTHDIDLEAARAAGVRVCRWPVGGAIRAAEHVMLQLLAVSKRLRAAEAAALAAGDAWGEARRTDEDTFAYNWTGQTAIGTLWGQTVGILGFGEIGAELARRLAGWGGTLLYHRRQPLPPAVEAELGITFASLETLQARSDYLVNLLPYSPATDGLLDAPFLAGMKPGACLVSAGSGSVIEEAALAAAVDSGQLAGAALDTFEWEPLAADNSLVKLARAGANVVLTPHTAGGTLADARADTRAIYTNILRHRAGQPLLFEIT